MIKDQLLGRTSRDYDILVFGDFEKLARILNSLTPGLLSSGRVPHSDSHNILIETSSSEKCTIDFINAADFLLRYSHDFKCPVPPGVSEDELVRYAVNFSDFTINACAISVSSPHVQISHPRWEIDCSARSIELSSPEVLSVPHWPGVKALLLAAEVGGTLSPPLTRALKEYAKGGVWRNIPADLLYRQIVRLFASADPLRSAELLRDSGLLSAMFWRDEVPARTFARLKELEGNPLLPRLGADSYSPWYVSALLCGEGGKTSKPPLFTALRPEHAQSLEALASTLPRILKTAYPLETE
jgi:hypothetical protein